jgi:Flp pilus assembly secretin CpaC
VEANGRIFLQIEAEDTAPNNALGTRAGGSFVAGHRAQRVSGALNLADGQTLIIGQDSNPDFSAQVTAHVINPSANGVKLVQLVVTWISPRTKLTQLLAPRVFSAVTLSGRPGELLVGGEQAVPGAAGIQFVDVGTHLTFLPIVLGNGKIRLEIDTSQSRLDQFLGVHFQGGKVAGHAMDQVQTTVELQDGQSLVLAEDDAAPLSIQVTPHLLGNGMVQLEVRAVERLFARPFVESPNTFSLVTLSGLPSALLIGGEQAVPGAADIQFVDVGTHLKFLPIVLGNGMINLQIDTSESTLDEALGVHIPGGRVAGHAVDRVDTTVVLADGQSLVLAQDDSAQLSIQVTPHLLANRMVLLEVQFIGRPRAQVRLGADVPLAFSAVALSGRPSELLIGGEQAQLQGTGDIQFVGVGTDLNWTPIIQQGGQIQLKIRLAVGDGGPTSQHVNTTVTLADGQSLVIAHDAATGFSVTITPHLLDNRVVRLDVEVIGPT